MIRERTLKIVLLLVGLLFVAAIYPVAMDLWRPAADSNSGDDMMMSLYFALGVFLLIASRNPSAHRSLIAFAGWSSFAHAVVMSALGFQRQYAEARVGFWWGSVLLVVIGAALLGLAPAKPAAPCGAAAA